MFMIGRGRAREFAEAAKEALQAIHAPSFLLYQTSPLYLEEAARIIAQKYPYTPSLGVPSITLCGKDVDLDKLVIVTGACPRGADRLAEDWAFLRGIRYERWLADWDKHGRSAGIRRNAEMVAGCGARAAVFTAPVATGLVPQAGW